MAEIVHVPTPSMVILAPDTLHFVGVVDVLNTMDEANRGGGLGVATLAVSANGVALYWRSAGCGKVITGLPRATTSVNICVSELPDELVAVKLIA